MSPKRKQSATSDPALKRVKIGAEDASKTPNSRKYQLIPMQPRENASLGNKNEKLLHMLCKNSKTNRIQEQHFRGIIHSEVDWDSKEHIDKINSWRNQLYSRAGLGRKSVMLWHEDEKAWMELWWQLVVVEACKHGLMLPRCNDMHSAFDVYFTGKTLKDSNGENMEPRQQRSINSFNSTYSRTGIELRFRAEMISLGKPGDTFCPNITPSILHKFKTLKKKMTDKGLRTDRESNYSDNLDDWQKFISGVAALADGDNDDSGIFATTDISYDDIDCPETDETFDNELLALAGGFDSEDDTDPVIKQEVASSTGEIAPYIFDSTNDVHANASFDDSSFLSDVFGDGSFATQQESHDYTITTVAGSSPLAGKAMSFSRSKSPNESSVRKVPIATLLNYTNSSTQT
ncbi:hypothetical protein BS50DRAFT_629534 [Corynespora cassiicola Philippines]|uniref:Uncharacterized protein n=1 Tax=Corynespora cassiicola Philippines TaxID=1448308 RepID=A0A2T2P7D1_CORCC|nr:hypothetical protein BS50DRAFT_629534 [Corynespora cassiicola Philippines]